MMPVFMDTCKFMMTSSSVNIFSVTGPLCWEFTGHRWIPRTKASDTELWCFLWSVLAQTVKQTIETLVMWDAVALIMTSLWCITSTVLASLFGAIKKCAVKIAINGYFRIGLVIGCQLHSKQGLFPNITFEGLSCGVPSQPPVNANGTVGRQCVILRRQVPPILRKRRPVIMTTKGRMLHLASHWDLFYNDIFYNVPLLQMIISTPDNTI